MIENLNEDSWKISKIKIFQIRKYNFQVNWYKSEKSGLNIYTFIEKHNIAQYLQTFLSHFSKSTVWNLILNTIQLKIA